MPRIRRGLIDDGIYHVINRGNGRQTVFHKDRDYESFLKLLHEAKEHFQIKLYAWCLMPNHYHMAMTPAAGEDLSRCMQWLGTSHVRRYHRHYGGSGHVWQGRYKNFLVQEDSHLKMVMRYIEANPVRARLVASAREWPWSSHLEAIGTKTRTLTDSVPFELPVDWGGFVDDSIEKTEIERIRASVNRQTPYGDDTWQMKICKALDLGSTLRKQGRPRKESDNAKK